MSTLARLFFLVLLGQPGLVLGSDDNTLWMEAKPINGRMVFVRLWPAKTWRIERDIEVYVGTRPGDTPVRCSDVVVTARDQKGHPVKVESVINADHKGFFVHRVNDPDNGGYEAILKMGQKVASIRVQWKKESQTFLLSEAKRNVDWDMARAWCGYVDPVGDLYTISLPDDVPLENLHIHYYTDGQDGRGLYGQRGADGTVTIMGIAGKARSPNHAGNLNNLTFDIGHPKTLEAVVFLPGYETTTFYEPSLKTSDHKMLLQPKALPMMHLSGRIDSYKAVTAKDPIVEISYSELFGFSHFFGVNVLLPTFRIATVPLNSDGTFTAEIHDLAHDPVAAPRPDERGVMTVLVREKASHNVLLWLSTDPKRNFGYFPIQPRYDDVVTFYASKETFK
jgi:hypothetical protein